MTYAVDQLAAILATALFIFSLYWMNDPKTARHAVVAGVAGMLVAVLATWFQPAIVHHGWIVLAIAAGFVVGVPLSRVPLTAVPQRTALSHAFGGLAAGLVGTAEYFLGLTENPAQLTAFRMSAIVAEVILGFLTFTGSLMAAGKLQEVKWIPQRPVTYPGQNFVNIGVLVAAGALGVVVVMHPTAAWSAQAFYAIAGLAVLFGVLLIIPIGGADMPTVISILNSYAGLSAVAMGFVLDNKLLVTAGALDGSSGLILSIIMCRAMNRSFTNVLFGAFGTVQKTAAIGEQKAWKQETTEGAAQLLEQANLVVVIPGYDHEVGLLEQLRRPFGRFLHPRLLLSDGDRLLHRPEGPEQHVGERPVHGPAHDDGKDQPARAVQRPRGHEQLVVEHKAHRDGREAGVGVEDRDHGGHVGAADGDDEQHPEEQGETRHGEERPRRPRRRRVQDDQHAERHSDDQHTHVDDVLPEISDGSLRDPRDLLQFSRGHEAAGECEKAEDDLRDDGAHAERRELRGTRAHAEEVLRRPHQAGGEPAERVRQGGPLRHRREGHQGERHADDEPGQDGQDDPAVVDDLRLNPGRPHRDHHARHARHDTAAGRLGIVHPVQREDEQGRREHRGGLGDRVDHCFLNILSMRSVIRNPLTMLVMEANSATAPMMRIVDG